MGAIRDSNKSVTQDGRERILNIVDQPHHGKEVEAKVQAAINDLHNEVKEIREYLFQAKEESDCTDIMIEYCNDGVAES